MKTQVSRHLSSLSDEIASTRARLKRLRDRLEIERAALEEQRLRMLIAETPLADRDLHSVTEGFLQLAHEVRRVEAALETLREQRRLLSERLTSA
jgi:hypothetical protein